jgi:hypothetical protein
VESGPSLAPSPISHAFAAAELLPPAEAFAAGKSAVEFAERFRFAPVGQAFPRARRGRYCFAVNAVSFTFIESPGVGDDCILIGFCSAFDGRTQPALRAVEGSGGCAASAACKSVEATAEVTLIHRSKTHLNGKSFAGFRMALPLFSCAKCIFLIPCRIERDIRINRVVNS